jgi:hypothetical protein
MRSPTEGKGAHPDFTREAGSCFRRAAKIAAPSQSLRCWMFNGRVIGGKKAAEALAQRFYSRASNQSQV